MRAARLYKFKETSVQHFARMWRVHAFTPVHSKMEILLNLASAIIAHSLIMYGSRTDMGVQQ